MNKNQQLSLDMLFCSVNTIDDPPIFGAGRIVELNEPMELDLAVDAVKSHLGLGYVQLAYGGSK